MSSCVFNPALSTSAKLVFGKFPGVEFSTQVFGIPEIRAVFPEQAARTQWLPMPPGAIEYGDFTLEFIVDSTLANYLSIVRWIQAAPTMPVSDIYSDASVIFTDNLKRPNGITASFKDLMPYHITKLEYQMNTQNPQPLIAVASFKYTNFTFD